MAQGPERNDPIAIVVMGVSASGKTELGIALSRRLGWIFVDADDLHPAANVAKMSVGTPLDDEDRRPWLDKVADTIRGWLDHGESGIIACSALKAVYRDRLRVDDRVRFAFIKGEFDQILARMAGREEHFMPVSLLESQFATLEEPAAGEAIVVDAKLSTEEAADFVIAALARRE